MTEQTLHPTPSWSVVAKEEFGALGIGLRREMQLFAAALIVFAALILIGWARNAGGGARAGFVPGYGIVAPILLIGLFAPLAIWKGDTPAQRGYFWSMP
ncbi:MAG TPA: hypothetical protein VFI96_05195, partial [Longimicrobiaceae bacterium]|nr:hypothetical protein [Longimicrobiaceae bacterium]